MKRGVITAVLLSVVMLAGAVSFPQEVISCNDIDLDFRISNGQLFELSVATGTNYTLTFDPSLDFTMKRVAPELESILALQLEPAVSVDQDSTLTLDVDFSGTYGNRFYFTPEAGFPVGLEVVPDVDISYSNTAPAPFAVDAGLYLAFLGGRVVDQGELLNAMLLAEAMGVSVDDATLREIAMLLTGYTEHAGGIPDGKTEMFAGTLSELLGIPGRDLQAYMAYQTVAAQRTTAGNRSLDAATGFRFKIGFQTDFSTTTQLLSVATVPEFTFAGNLGDRVWFSLSGGANLPLMTFDLGGVTAPVFLETDRLAVGASADISWFASPYIAIHSGTDLVWINIFSDPLVTPPGAELFLTTTLSANMVISDTVSLVVELPVGLVPSVTADLGIYFTWDIL